MPTYQYVCTECATPLEVVQSFTDPALVECPTCGGRLRKVFSAVGVMFKGSGFYRNDSRREKAPVDGGSKPGDAKGGSGSTSTGDSSGAGDNKGARDGKPSGGKDAGGSAEASSGSGAKNGSGSSAAKGTPTSSGSGSSNTARTGTSKP